MKKMCIAIAIFFIMVFSACSGNSDSPGETVVPVYDTDTPITANYAADLSSVTDTVRFWQNKGALLAELANSLGRVNLGEDLSVRLTEIYKNDCPEDLCSGDLSDATLLGISENSLITDFPETETIRNQSERGTCVSFALNAALEVLENRNGVVSPDLSEQNSYFMGKKLTGTWEEAGLVPAIVIQQMVQNSVQFVHESSWPYNPYQEDCEYYSKIYPDFYCSETEAQGGGSDSKQQDPNAMNDSGISILEAQQLYASIDRVRQALYRGYPVILSLNANSDFVVATQKGGVVSWVFKIPGCLSDVCGHAVLAIGYQDDELVDGGGYIIVKNSWGESWGDGGYAYLTYEWLENSILDAQAIAAIK